MLGREFQRLECMATYAALGQLTSLQHPPVPAPNNLTRQINVIVIEHIRGLNDRVVATDFDFPIDALPEAFEADGVVADHTVFNGELEPRLAPVSPLVPNAQSSNTVPPIAISEGG